MAGGGTGSKGRTARALVKRFLLKRFHMRLMLCCGGSLSFFFLLFASLELLGGGGFLIHLRQL